MRLTKLIVQGFKSFADRTEFSFNSPITAIVGPNGCGKSNVVDAFKWVLGEQSAKSLRGDAMADVIFNGSGTRKPGTMAEVTLVFTNPLRDDGTRALALETDEVAVGRRLFRDGQSQYTLNSNVSRLKDVRELFMDTGVGVDAYSVIEQGKVAAMLEANPAERRQIFEEAAGISKFKQRRKEAQRKLDAVDQNLLRVGDTLAEVERRLRGVKIQAGKARTYNEYQTRLQELRLSYALAEVHKLRQEKLTADRSLDDARFTLDEATAAMQTAVASATETEERVAACRSQLEDAKMSRQQAIAQRDQAAQKAVYAQRQSEQLAAQLEDSKHETARDDARLAAVKEQLAAEETRLAEVSAEVANRQTHIDVLAKAFAAEQMRANELQRAIDQHRSAALEQMRRVGQCTNRLSGIEIELRNNAQQAARQASRREEIEKESTEVQSGITAAESRVVEADKIIQNIDAELAQTRTEAESLTQHQKSLAESVTSAKVHRSGLESRRRTLADLESRREGVGDAVRKLLDAKQRNTADTSALNGIRGLVADLLRVDLEHAVVVEAALEGRDQWLVCDASTLAAVPSMGLTGRVSFVAQTSMAPTGVATARAYDWNQHSTRVRLLADLIRHEPADAWLIDAIAGDAAAVDTLEEAVTLAQQLPPGFRLITKSGEVVASASGAVRATVGGKSAGTGTLSRRSELESLAQQITAATAQIDQLVASMSEADVTARELEQSLSRHRQALGASKDERVQASSTRAQLADRLSRLSRETPSIERELAQLAQFAGSIAAEKEKVAAQQAEAEIKQAELQKAADDARTGLDALQCTLKASSEALAAARVEVARYQQQEIAARQTYQRLASTVTEVIQQLERQHRQQEAARQRIGELAIEQSSAREREERAATDCEQLQEVITEAAQALSAAETEMSGFRQQIDQSRKQYEAAGSVLHKAELAVNELHLRFEGVIARGQEELQINIAEELDTRDAAARAVGSGGEPGAAWVPPEADYAAMAQEIRELREKLSRLGGVNLEAIAEQSELEQKNAFISQQVADLAESKRQLVQMIDELGAQCSQRFEETFNRVREHFAGMFRKLFGGGKAELFLETEITEPVTVGAGTDPNTPLINGEINAAGQLVTTKKIDALEAGIEIMARPPGKQPVSISQLSGGEKTMTCVALLLSIFKSKPSPFCILDEVDAALDEANNQRFNLIVQEFLAESQFIIITHSKRTMQVADVLYGVTMQEQGVSKRVAVKFDQVEDGGRLVGAVA